MKLCYILLHKIEARDLISQPMTVGNYARVELLCEYCMARSFSCVQCSCVQCSCVQCITRHARPCDGRKQHERSIIQALVSFSAVQCARCILLAIRSSEYFLVCKICLLTFLRKSSSCKAYDCVVLENYIGIVAIYLLLFFRETLV